MRWNRFMTSQSIRALSSLARTILSRRARSSAIFGQGPAGDTVTMVTQSRTTSITTRTSILLLAAALLAGSIAVEPLAASAGILPLHSVTFHENDTSSDATI